MPRKRVGIELRRADGNDPELLIRYLEYVLVDVAAVNPSSARLLKLAIEHLQGCDSPVGEARPVIN